MVYCFLSLCYSKFEAFLIGLERIKLLLIGVCEQTRVLRVQLVCGANPSARSPAEDIIHHVHRLNQWEACRHTTIGIVSGSTENGNFAITFGVCSAASHLE